LDGLWGMYQWLDRAPKGRNEETGGIWWRRHDEYDKRWAKFSAAWCNQEDVPGDLVTASGSGLDPHITLANAEFQLDRIAAKWADDTKHDAGDVRKDIEQILQNSVSAPFGGLAGEKLVNVLEVNLELCKRYGLPK
jgi:K+-transporting ATPase ATPase C chain